MSERIGAVIGLAAYVSEVEERHQIRHARTPDPGFAATIAAWVRGAPLSTVLDIADAEVGTLSPGDFVRNAKQVGDLCEQVTRLCVGTPLAEAAEEARTAVIRSVVAGASMVPPTPDGAL